MPSRRELANAIRALSMDAVEKATCGHPGAPMGMADIAEVLWNDFLRHNPSNPEWADRDRFVLSNGHGSMLLYSLLHLTGYDLSIEEIKNFRQWHSKTPGHPEYGDTPGVETTTGPLGQGIANAVGMALAEKLLAQEFNRDGMTIVDHHTYAFLGDGCMMEGISHEVCSFAGTHGLGKLVAFYDDNGISIDGHVEGWFTDDTPQRFQAYGWHVIPNVNGHDPEAVKNAVELAKGVTDKPTLICCKTVIAFGAPNACGTAKAHGEKLGTDEIKATRENINWPHAPFVVPDDIRAGWDAKAKGQALEDSWQTTFSAYQKAHPELAAEFERRVQGNTPDNFTGLAKEIIAKIDADAPNLATRASSKEVLNALAPSMPELFGGSADLSGSNGTQWKDAKVVSRGGPGNYMSYGVREFGMTAIMNGIALHGGHVPFGGTFLVFSDYARNAVRMAALMKLRNILVYTHDSIGLGEDGPTHQPVEHTSSLRLIPNLAVWRPCDAVETAAAWMDALTRRHGPTALILTRQKVPNQSRDSQVLANVGRGGYVLKDCDGAPQAIIIATGSEVELALKAADELSAEGNKVRVVSMPCVELFEAQDAGYKDSVLPSTVNARVAIEAGVSDFWYRYTGREGVVIGVNRFGASAPDSVLFENFGITAAAIKDAVTSLV